MPLSLKERRELVGLTQAELAQRAGLSEKTVRNLEAGTHSPVMRTAVAIARVLEVGVDELLAEASAT